MHWPEGSTWLNLDCMHACMQVMLTKTHLAIVMEYASGGNLTAYVTDRWDTSEERDGLFLTEDEARYFFRVRQILPCHGRGGAGRAHACWRE